MAESFREIRTVTSVRESPCPNFPPHLHDEIELCYVTEGHGFACCDGVRYELFSGMAFLAFPNQLHSYEGFSQGRYHIIITKVYHLHECEEFFRSGVPEEAACCCTAQEAVQLPELIGLAARETDADSLNDYLTLIIRKVLKHYHLVDSVVTADCLSDILRYCSLNYREKITVQMVAKSLHISISHVSHLFSDKLHIHFCDYLNNLRINEALLLLNSSSCSITEIAGKSGFSTLRTFNRAFFRQVGMTPSRYRAQVKEQHRLPS